MAIQHAPARRRSPLVVLALAAALNCSLLAFLAWRSYGSQQDLAAESWRDMRIQELRGRILHLGEVLTMSARMAAVTGELAWEGRHGELKPQLDAAIEEAARLAPEAHSAQGIAKTAKANAELAAMESKAFEFLGIDSASEALAILFGDEYRRQKSIYVQEMATFAQSKTGHVRSEELRGTIVHLDEVLTTSARMSAITGDPAWEDRYRRHQGELHAAIAEAMTLSPEAGSAMAEATKEAHVKQTAMEECAFDLVGRGQLAEAEAILFGQDYEEQRRIHREGMTAFAERLSAQAVSALKKDQRAALSCVVGALVAIAIMTAGWLVVYFSVSKWKAALTRSAEHVTKQAWELAHLNESLDRKVMKRTATLQLEVSRRTEAQRQLQETNERLEHLAATDALTGLPNRRYLLETLHRELERVQRDGGELTAAVLDVDYLKAVNDAYGHAMGDAALVAAARITRSAVRQADFVARWGGDEFVLLLSGIDADAAVEVVERIREKIADSTVIDDKRAVKTSLSAGIATARKEDGRSLPSLLALADDALYTAKRAGRNCTRTWRDLDDQGAVGLSGETEETLQKVAALKRRVTAASIQGLWSLIEALEARDPYTRGHSENVTRYAVGIARTMGLDAKDIETLKRAAIAHDIGKIGVPDYVLNKPGALTDEERELMQSHVLTGVRILAELRLLEREVQIVRGHHERWDGGGYPDGSPGQSVPVESRILSVADTLDAITSERVYREGRDLAAAVDIITSEAGTQFDPNVVEALLQWVAEVSGRSAQADALTIAELLETQATATAIAETEWHVRAYGVEAQ